MKQITKKCLLTLSLVIFTSIPIISNTYLSEEAIIASYEQDDNAWKYVEFLCCVQPKNKLNTYLNHAYGSLGGIGALFLGKQFLYPAEATQANTTKPDFVNKALVAISAFAATNTMYNFFTCYMKRTINKETLQNILHKWDLHRPYFPSALVPCFNELHELYADKGDDILTDGLVSETFELIQHHIEHFFDKRYKPADEKKESTIATFKTVTDVWKNLG